MTTHPPNILLPESDEELLAECEVDTFRSSGKGGQHVNKTESAVRLRHLPTGIVVSCQSERSQYQNKRQCLAKLRARVERLNRRRKPRVKTKVPKAAREGRLEGKAHQAKKKQLRRPPKGSE